MAEPRLIILDRDGVINRDSKNFVKTAAEWQALPGSIDAIAALSKAGFVVTVASNQSGIGRGLFDRNALRAMHRKLRKQVEAAGGRVDRIVVCPHEPNHGCKCRKPKAGLIHRLLRHYRTPAAGVAVIGDSLRDLQAATAAGARPVLVRTGNGRKTEKRLPAAMTSIAVFDDLAAAARALLRE